MITFVLGLIVLLFLILRIFIWLDRCSMEYDEITKKVSRDFRSKMKNADDNFEAIEIAFHVLGSLTLFLLILYISFNSVIEEFGYIIGIIFYIIIFFLSFIPTRIIMWLSEESRYHYPWVQVLYYRMFWEGFYSDKKKSGFFSLIEKIRKNIYKNTPKVIGWTKFIYKTIIAPAFVSIIIYLITGEVSISFITIPILGLLSLSIGIE